MRARIEDDSIIMDRHILESKDKMGEMTKKFEILIEKMK